MAKHWNTVIERAKVIHSFLDLKTKQEIRLNKTYNNKLIEEILTIIEYKKCKGYMPSPHEVLEVDKGRKVKESYTESKRK